MKFSVCIPAYRPETLATPIASIQAQNMPDWELIVVGQGNENSERARAVRSVAEAATAEDGRIRYIHLPRLGHSRALNAGINAAQSELVALLDDDCYAQPDWLETYMKYFAMWPDVGLIGGATYAPPKSQRGPGVCPTMVPAEGVYDPSASSNGPPAGVDWISCNVALRRATAEQVGPFDEFLGPGTDFPAGGETDFKLRMETLGIKIGATPQAQIEHTHGYRYGLKAIWEHSWNYAYGNGALAGKQTLANDPRGEQWVEMTKKERWQRWQRPFRPYRLPFDLLRLRTFRAGYDHCLQTYRVADSLLQPRQEAQAA